MNKKAIVHLIIKIFFIENECKAPIRSLRYIIHKNIFYDKMDLKLFHFHVTIDDLKSTIRIFWPFMLLTCKGFARTLANILDGELCNNS